MNKYIIIIFYILAIKYTIAQTTATGNVNINLPLITLMDIEPSGQIDLFFTAPNEAGNPLNSPTNTSKWINYTSSVASASISKKITAHTSELITGIDIKLQASPSSTGAGIKGIPTGEIILSTSPQTIITGIKGAYTGNGTNNGHQLTISLNANNYSNLIQTNNKIILITYTMSQE